MAKDPFNLTGSTKSSPFNIIGKLGTLGIIHDGGGTYDYNELYNKPSINGQELVGDMPLDDLGISLEKLGDVPIDDETIINAVNSAFNIDNNS